MTVQASTSSYWKAETGGWLWFRGQPLLQSKNMSQKTSFFSALPTLPHRNVGLPKPRNPYRFLLLSGKSWSPLQVLEEVITCSVIFITIFALYFFFFLPLVGLIFIWSMLGHSARPVHSSWPCSKSTVHCLPAVATLDQVRLLGSPCWSLTGALSSLSPFLSSLCPLRLASVLVS